MSDRQTNIPGTVAYSEARAEAAETALAEANARVGVLTEALREIEAIGGQYPVGVEPAWTMRNIAYVALQPAPRPATPEDD